MVLHDVYIVEKRVQFNRERVVHAKGGGAFGTLTTTDDLSHSIPAQHFVSIRHGDADAGTLFFRCRRTRADAPARQ
ncbi:catalase [Rhizobium sullae]|uniref:catalase n=1 Tax=Rhizobium sullae TaxID=50338 RepID=UPI0018E23B53